MFVFDDASVDGRSNWPELAHVCTDIDDFTARTYIRLIVTTEYNNVLDFFFFSPSFSLTCVTA